MKTIELHKGYKTLVDDDDYDRLSKYKWRVEIRQHTGIPYVARATKTGGSWYMHWDVLPPEKGYLTDHINRNTLDNRKCNLRNATPAQSNANRWIVGKSGFKGVYEMRNTKTNPWRAKIRYEYEEINLGCFPTAEQAARAYNKAALEYYGEFATLNPL